MAEVKVYSFIGKKKNNYDLNSYISGQDFCAAIEAADATADERTKVSIHSGGGSVTDGFLVMAGMQKSTKPVDCVIDGYAASMAALIPLACSGKITAARNSIIMTHQVIGSITGNADEMRAEAEVLDKFNAVIIDALVRRTGLTAEEARAKFLAKDTWFTAQEAVDAKLIDGIEEYDAENIPAVTASMSYAEATVKYAAMMNATEEKSFLEKAVAHVKSVFGLTEKGVKAKLTTDEENQLCSVLWDVKMAADDADYALKNCADPEAKALLEEVMTTCSALTIKITNKVYGEEITEPVALAAKTTEYLAKAPAKGTPVDTAKVIEAAREFTAKELKAKDDLLTHASTEIEALKLKVATLEAEPAANDRKPLVDDDKAPKQDMSREDLEAKFFA
jgi:ATP-dependent Clp endopeptidase proteolytic subunit ClpP